MNYLVYAKIFGNLELLIHSIIYMLCKPLIMPYSKAIGIVTLISRIFLIII